MTVSSISPITFEGQPRELASFSRAGVMYVLWHSAITDTGVSRLHWKPHTGLDFTEVTPALAEVFTNVTALYHPASDQLVVLWDDGLANFGSVNGSISYARFDVLTGDLVFGPTVLFPGSEPKLSYRTTAGDEWLMYYLTPKTGGIYGRLSLDGGTTWQSGEPVITNQVAETRRVKVIPYDAGHVSIAQLGDDPRGLSEIGMLQRTRPLRSIVKHPTVANQFFVGEPSKFDDVTLIDNLRGGLVLATNNSKLYHLDGVAQGTSDGVGAVALIAISGLAISVSGSAGPTGDGDDVREYSLTPALGTLNVDLPGASFAVDLGVSATHGYVAEYADNSSVLGQLIVVDLSTGSTGTTLTGVEAVRAVGVANFLATPLVFVATTESGVNRLRVYQQNALTPTLLLNTKLPARAQSIRAVAHPTDPLAARLLIAMTDRFNVYDYFSAADPVQLFDSHRFSGGARFFGSAVSSSGAIVVAAGNSGVLVLSPTGKIKAHLRVSGKVVSEWAPFTAYTTGQFVKPRAKHPFARNRAYFRNTTSGTSGAAEPSWADTGTILDATAQWTKQGLLDGVVVDVALDAAASRIYAVGVVGGDLGTDGRVWMLNAAGVL